MKNSKVVYLLTGNSSTYNALSISEVRTGASMKIIAADNRLGGVY